MKITYCFLFALSIVLAWRLLWRWFWYDVYAALKWRRARDEWRREIANRRITFSGSTAVDLDGNELRKPFLRNVRASDFQPRFSVHKGLPGDFCLLVDQLGQPYVATESDDFWRLFRVTGTSQSANVIQVDTSRALLIAREREEAK